MKHVISPHAYINLLKIFRRLAYAYISLEKKLRYKIKFDIIITILSVDMILVGIFDNC